MKIVRESWESNYDFLYKLFNQFGATELAIQGMSQDNHFLRRYFFKDLIEMDPTKWIKGYYNQDKLRPMTVLEFIESASHRTILDIEVMMDVDDIYHNILDFSDIRKKSQWIIRDLKRKNKDVSVYFTGNKSYHISYIDEELRRITRSQRTKYKEGVLSHYYADLGKCSELNLIAIEGQPHYRSGRNKRRVLL